MTRESLARKFHPVGFEQPENSRKNYVKPRAELQEAFDRWVEELPETYLHFEKAENQYKKACKSTQPLGEIPYRESNSLLADFNPKTYGQKEVGLFISACYIHSPEQTIIFDLDAPEIEYIGYKTNKNIFNNGKVGNWFAYASSGLSVNNGDCGGVFARDSSGLVVNNGECGNWFAQRSSGPAVNNGECGDCFASYSSGLAITIKKPKSYGYREKGRTIKSADCDRIPELRKYLEELCDLTRGIKDEESAKMFLERYGIGGEKIEPEIQEILDGNRPWVRCYRTLKNFFQK